MENAFPAPTMENVILIIDKLPPISTRHGFQDNPLYAYTLESISAVYHMELKTIFESPFNMAGKIDSVYVNFENQGWFWIDPQGVDFFNNVTQRRLENMLTELFADGILINAVTNEASWRRVDIEQVFATFPANTHITGCLSGEAAQGSMTFMDYISSMQLGETYVFVFGGFIGGDTEMFITENVKVSNYSIYPYSSISAIVNQLELQFSGQ
ncbi:uncharacterized protein [Spinacia oleracea]|uniref:Uncharacterized protein n=1 Tax=Spinacia oleracea TaxID=3562 RepID=A0ABM3R4R2_SPIOL|nr:uncharacterized protein LOC110805466 [Spinacia oleracea]XP_056690602.1 uncharacterized protein LOC110805466 [Spinacia oleracea]XP_056690603.1 uncharacterized protein LOC110805466 [Spinacia oleracea]